jgi:Kazal-type serine protease inhibitor domain
MRNPTPALACVALLTLGCTGSGLPSGTSTSGSSNGSTNGSTGGTTGNGSKSCGGFAGKECSSTEYCHWDDMSCGGGDQLGTCLARPTQCGTIYQPVCGCDGNTYPNFCLAQEEGVDVAFDGTCEGPVDMAQPPNQPCPQEGGDCGSAQYCKFPMGDACGVSGAAGTCTTRPQVCSDLAQPVCGCDGNNYGNSCEANGAGTDVAYDGMCTTQSDCRQTGCPSGQTCQICWTTYACLDKNTAC